MLVIKRHVAHLAADGIGEATRQLIGEVARKKKKFVRSFPEFILVSVEPVSFGFCLQIGSGFFHASQPKQ